MPATILLGLDREPDSELPLAEQFRFDAGSVALNLLATLGFRGSDQPVERLTSVRRLHAWLAAGAWPTVPANERDLGRLRAMRENAYDVLAARADGHRPDRQAVHALGELAARPLPGPALEVAGTAVRWQQPAATADTVLVGLARELAQLAVDGEDRLRRCAAPNCSMLYLDTSRGHRRRWCSMTRCGNAAKAARHRARAAEAVR